MTIKSLAPILFKDKSNRYCADCNIFLQEIHEIYASFFPISIHLDERWKQKKWIKTKHGTHFEELHESFAPPGEIASTRNSQTSTKALSGFIASCRNDRISLQSIAHGVFICKDCAEIHSKLDSSITKVKLTSDRSCWSEKEYNQMIRKGNRHGNYFLERFIPEEWMKQKSANFANKMEREVFIRYKYEILDFLFSKERWLKKKFMKKNQTATSKWKHLSMMKRKDVDWAIYTLGYKDYREKKTTATLKEKLQVPLDAVQEAEIILQDERRLQIQKIFSAIKIQSFLRMILTKRKLRHISTSHTILDVLRGTVRIQSFTRSYILAREYYHKKDIAIKIQAIFRGRRDRLLFGLIKDIITKLQAFVRGCQVRGLVQKEMKSRSLVYRQQIARLWEMSYTPLTYRTKFWMHIQSLGFIPFVSQERELVRLWRLFHFEGRDDSVYIEQPLNSALSNLINNKFLQVEEILERRPLQYNEESTLLLNEYAQRLKLERVQVYERMLQNESVDSIYQQVGITTDEKYRKVKIAKSVWNEAMMPSEMSSMIFLKLFPEIKKSADISPTFPSRKSFDRLGVHHDYVTNPMPRSVEGTTMDFKSNLDQQIIHNLADISRCFVTGVRHLALSRTLSAPFETFLLNSRHLEAMDSSKYALARKYRNT